MPEARDQGSGETIRPRWHRAQVDGSAAIILRLPHAITISIVPKRPARAPGRIWYATTDVPANPYACRRYLSTGWQWTRQVVHEELERVGLGGLP